MAEPTKEQVRALAEAMGDLLDDMGKDGLSVCGLAKARARLAWEPFKVDDTGEAYEPEYPLEEARRTVEFCDGLHRTHGLHAWQSPPERSR